MTDELSTLLGRAAATPRGGPHVTPPRAPRSRVPFVALAAGLVTVLAVVAVVVVATRGAGPSEPSPTPTAAGVRVGDDGVSVVLPDGWHRSRVPTAPWLHSPHEVLAFADAPIADGPDDGANHAACASEIPEVGVDAARAGGAFVWIGDLSGGATFDPPPERPRSFADASWRPLCALTGMETRGTTFTEGGRDLIVSVVTRSDAPAEVRHQVDELLDSVSVTPR